MITIPSTVREAWEDLTKNCLATEDYSYLVFDIKKAETDPKKKVQIFMKVYVPEAKRRTATANVKAAMEKEGYVVAVGKKKGSEIPSLDIHVGIENNKTQVIRVEFKPENSAGSGGGSAKTAVQESAACLYNALRFHVFNKDMEPGMMITEDDLTKASDFIDCPSVTLEQMMGFDEDWQQVFMDGANKLHAKVSGGDYLFVRGDKEIDDGVIKKAFSKCKTSLESNLQNEDKWNPSDIWMVKRSSKASVIAELTPYGKKKTATSIEVLNAKLAELFASKDLMGVSLKKTGASGTVKVINAETPAQRKAQLEVAFDKNKTIGELVYDSGRNYTGSEIDKRYPMDVYIYYGPKPYDRIQLRNFGGDTTGDWKLELKGEYAAMGKVQGSVARFILNKTGFSNIPQEPTWAESDPKHSQSDKISKEIFKLLKKFNAKGFDKTDEDQMMGEIEGKRQSWRYSKLSGLRFLKFLNDLNGEADNAVKELYLFAGSASDHSSIYYKYS
ncbi:hypothetical protein Syn1_159 [Prochlorococcus phage Syn1]|uniref:Uncharacterized protein n=2 Tax=Vellamovirus TaxID=2733139 RepID=E3SPP4_9CAUD|nr:hypothetical protein Syn1_159 [Prochlorococcus phage Syn1]ADO99260.1 hypothetical protein Syn1_159 [Prochlorococcus phage Syn1]AMO43401.1 hypothetical protein W270710_157 [Cyanophage S-RIM44]